MVNIIGFGGHKVSVKLLNPVFLATNNKQVYDPVSFYLTKIGGGEGQNLT
jgi:hypothetical protein